MQLLLWSLIILFGIAVLIDKAMTEEGVRAWRDSTRELRGKIVELEIDGATTAANGLFCRLFDMIYGEHFWSKRRFIRSYLSSLLALTAITLLLDLETTYVGGIFYMGWNDIFVTIVIIFVINTCADYLSLQETRWILGRSREANVTKLCGWVIVDFVVTAGIYLFIFYIVIAATIFFLAGEVFSIAEYFEEMVFNESVFLTRDQGLPFFLSTFFTSALWLLFITSALVIRAMKRSSRVLRISLDTIAESHAPARTTAGIMTIVLIAGYGAVQALTWVMGF